MPSPATMQGANRSPQAAQATAPTMVVPFIRASAEHREPMGLDVSRQITTSEQDLGVFDIPAYGYVRSIVLLVTASAGAGGTIVATEDGPWNAIKNIALTEPNGAVLQQFNSGFDCYLANKYGGYRFASDLKTSPTYSAITAAGGNFSFMLRIPVELSARDALGSLPNQNAAATFKLRLTLAKMADLFGGTPTTAPTVRVQGYLEAWEQPEAVVAGRSNQVTPPAVNTTQFWSAQQYNVNAGEQSIQLTRVGNHIRNLFLIYRTAGGRVGANGDTAFPAVTTIALDARPLDTVDKRLWKHQMQERTNFIGAANAANGLDDGVFVYDFTHEFNGSLGFENRDLWLPTLGSTRLEVKGNFATAGTLTVLTNDVAVAGEAYL